MIRILQFTNPWILLFLALAIASPVPLRVAAQSPRPNNQSLPTNWGAYEPDGNIGSPGRREGGGTRGPCVQKSANDKVMPLVPVNGFGTTTAEYPTFSVYLPPLLPESNPEIEFVLKTPAEEEKKIPAKEIYKTKFKINRGAGIISFSLPNTSNLPALELNKNYLWSVTLICDPEAVDSGDLTGNEVASGAIRRVTPKPNVQQELATAKSAIDRVTIYAKAGIWYDALSNLAELRRRNPNDPMVIRDWQELLKSVGMEKLAQEPLSQPVVGRNQLNSSVSGDN
ncbi:DUF928 domain-containing protein [Aerosakkonemataceae cyanobacterium BLCC-F50]|uniref:DUF928 domain-containing protein n=1 Tax=Floridaenema flaviceps BLCC-F50 TaxID=3153642 RepID=A0ABV4XSG6_9CYAN